MESQDERQPSDAGASASSPSGADTPDLRAESPSPAPAPSDARPPGALSADDVLGDRYRIRGLLGRGGMATLYLADDLRTGGQVAIKVPRAPRHARRIEREAFAAARVRHRALVASLDRGLLPDGTTPYVVLELLEGETLGRRARREVLPLGEVLRIVAEVIGAVGALHAAGIVHRDLKPDNVMLCGDDRVKVIDLGFALIGDEPRITGDNERIGTPGFVAPEQILAPEIVDARADVYSIGAMLRCLLCGRGALVAASSFDAPTFLKALERRPPLRACAPRGTPRALLQVIEKAEQLAPRRRYASIDDLGDALAAACIAMSRAPRRRRGVIATAAAALVLGAGAMGWLRPMPTPTPVPMIAGGQGGAQKPEPKPAPRQEPKLAPKSAPKPEPKPAPRPEPKPESKPPIRVEDIQFKLRDL